MPVKRKQSEGDSKIHWKKVGSFDAFNPQAPLPKKRKPTKSRATGWVNNPKKPKFVKCEELPEPEVGIHSLAWAQAIAPQKSGFLRLPIECRNRIYEHVIDDWTVGGEKGSPITPWKKGSKFYDRNWRNAPKETEALYLLSRQVYVDVVGSGLLYQFRKFSFTSPSTMLNYLWVINPRHKDAIRTIQLDLNLNIYQKCFDDKSPRACGRPFEMIASCKNLQHFTLNIDLYPWHLTIHRGPPYNSYGWGTAKSVSVDENVLKVITDCVALKAIRGLKSFELFFHASLPFEEKNQVRLLQVEEGIRKLVTMKDNDTRALT